MQRPYFLWRHTIFYAVLTAVVITGENVDDVVVGPFEGPEPKADILLY
jgi:hypothetical protein